MKTLGIFMVCLSILFKTEAQNNSEANKIIGLWQTGSGKCKIQITGYGDKFGGKLVWLREPLDAKGKPKLDDKNPDPAKKKNTKIGLNNLLGLTYEGQGRYENGTIYDPENGKTYRCVMNLQNDSTIKVRGYSGIITLGRTDVWKRIK
jgi:uncharacterized protein (DUF2147 family)